MKMLALPFVCLVAMPLQADDLTLEPRRLHLGKPGLYEWDEFKNRPLDGEHLELRFQARANGREQTLRIWQSHVKLNWQIKLNGKPLGALTTAETPMESVFAVGPGLLVEGDNQLVVEAPLQLDDIEIGPVTITPEPVKAFLESASLEVEVRDADSDSTIPCRLTLTRPDGTLQPLMAGPEGHIASRTGVVYTRDGKARISVPEGNYVLHAGRGFEWSVAQQPLTVKAGDSLRIALSLKREVDTHGWIAADSHIHTLTHSGHGDAQIEERMLTIAGEGIELAISTDHNHHTDYASAARSTGLLAAFTHVIGNEVTTKQGHFNAFPVQAGAKVVNHQEQNWSRLIPAIRATPGVKVITLNHPRDLHSGFVPLGGLQFNPKTGRHRNAAALDIDAMEVITSAAMQSDIHLLYHDWFALLNRGHRIAAIASSDSHDVNRFILGQGRTYVAARDGDPAGLDLDEVWRSYDEGRLLVSLGLLADIRVNGRFGVGDLATGLKDIIQVTITVSGPSWVQADHVELYANGILLRQQALTDDHQSGVKARLAFELPKPVHDVHLVAIATGPGVREAFWEIPRPYQPASKIFTPRVIGSTNPVWLDADNDGRFSSAFDIAQRLVKMGKRDAVMIKEAANDCDDAVKSQIESLLSEP